MAEPLQLAPIPASIDNREDWDAITGQITHATGLPLATTPELVLAMVRSAVPLAYEAELAGNAGLLRGTFADSVVAQCQRNRADLLTGKPASAAVHLVGARVVDGRAILRLHLVIEGRDERGAPTIDRHFWDLELGGQVTVGQQACPTCGAPVAPGELICDHCHTDMRSIVQVPLVVSRLELY